MNSTAAAFVHSPELDAYHYPADCPFSAQRAGKARKTLAELGLLAGDGRREVAPKPATRAELERFHAPEYLTALLRAAGGELDAAGLNMGLGTPDCPVFPDMYAYPEAACGASLTAARLLLAGEVSIAFNPSGGYHHAGPAHAAGFCYLNDVVLACQELTGHGRRVAFVDVDAHHGDGVQAAFYERDDVLTLSLHESGRTLFPGTGFVDEFGHGKGRGYSVNVPFPMGTYDAAYLRAFEAVAVPLLTAYAPDVLVLELGMDGLADDPLTNLRLTNNVYAEIIQRLLQLGRPLLATGGGGYHVENTARGWALAWSVLCGADESVELSAGLGGVMLESSEWSGGLRDRELPVDRRRRRLVEQAVDAAIANIRENVFPLHGLSA